MLLANLVAAQAQVFTPGTKDELKSALDAWNNGAAGGQAAYGPVGAWDVTLIAEFIGVALNQASFDENLSPWDTSAVTRTRAMFQGASQYDNGGAPLTFDTGSVTDMYLMFVNAQAFNQPIVFDTSRVTDMGSMFNGAAAFDQPLAFDVSRVVKLFPSSDGMFAMFDGRSEEHTTELQSPVPISYAVSCLKKKNMIVNTYS